LSMTEAWPEKLRAWPLRVLACWPIRSVSCTAHSTRHKQRHACCKSHTQFMQQMYCDS
jgi:hypothetical protein